MGTIQHHAIIATTWDRGKFEAIRGWVDELEEAHKPLFLFQERSLANGYHTVVLTPDGSNEGWDSSKEGDTLRSCFLIRLKRDEYEDGSNPWKCVEVSFGELGAKLERSVGVENERSL